MVLDKSKNADLIGGKLPDFDHPPPNYSSVSKTDEGWTGIAKAVLLPNSSFSKVVKDSKHIKRKNLEWRQLTL